MKNYVFCTTLEEECIDTLKNIRHDIDLKHAQIHIITIVEIQVYNLELTPYVYPAESQYAEIEKSALMIMKSLGNSLGIEEKKITYKCFFEYNRESKVKSYLDHVDANLVITATRGKHGVAGFFSSSFTDYLCKFSPCDVLVMRPKKN